MIPLSLGFVVRPVPVSSSFLARAKSQNNYQGIIISAATSRHDHSVVDSIDTDETFNPVTTPATSLPSSLLPGSSEGYVVVEEYVVPDAGFQEIVLQPSTTTVSNNSNNHDHSWLDDDFIKRLKLTPQNVTLSVALLLLGPIEYPTVSRSRKACRKGTIVIHRHSAVIGDKDKDENENAKAVVTQVGRVSDRIYPGDTIGKQVRINSHGSYSTFLIPNVAPPFDLPVVYEDDHCAVVNKPAGVLVYAENAGGRNTVRFALPYVLKPSVSASIADDALPRPAACHRLDKPTSGLLVVAKTKAAAVHLTRQFEDRMVKKTYTAIVQGIPKEHANNTLTSREAHAMGVDVDPTLDIEITWQLAETVLDGKHAVTVWRSLGEFPSLAAPQQTVTMVELKPKTGRYHQLRRTMAWMYGCPIVGDTTYGEDASQQQQQNNDANAKKAKRWRRGLMLCSNSVRFQHPFFNTTTIEERGGWESSGEVPTCVESLASPPSTTTSSNIRPCISTASLHFSTDEENVVMVSASIDIPHKFNKFLDQEGMKYSYAGSEGENKDTH